MWYQDWGLQTEVLIAFCRLAPFPDNCGIISLDQKVPASWEFLCRKLEQCVYNVGSGAESLEFSTKVCKTLPPAVVLLYNIKWKVDLGWSQRLPQHGIRWHISKPTRITVKSPKATVTRQERGSLRKRAAETQPKSRPESDIEAQASTSGVWKQCCLEGQRPRPHRFLSWFGLALALKLKETIAFAIVACMLTHRDSELVGRQPLPFGYWRTIWHYLQELQSICLLAPQFFLKKHFSIDTHTCVNYQTYKAATSTGRKCWLSKSIS